MPARIVPKRGIGLPLRSRVKFVDSTIIITIITIILSTYASVVSISLMIHPFLY